ncbi:MAG: hypothetical protein R3E83_04940 [Burkholderiaceae bacterium]
MTSAPNRIDSVSACRPVLFARSIARARHALAGLALIAVAATPVLVHAGAPATVTLRYKMFEAGDAVYWYPVFEAWAQEIARRSDGRLKLVAARDETPLQPMTSPGKEAKPASPAEPGALGALREGRIDLLWLRPTDLPAVFPRIGAFELPLMVRDAKAASRALWEYMHVYAPDELKDVRVLAMHVQGPAQLHLPATWREAADPLCARPLLTGSRPLRHLFAGLSCPAPSPKAAAQSNHETGGLRVSSVRPGESAASLNGGPGTPAGTRANGGAPRLDPADASAVPRPQPKDPPPGGVREQSVVGGVQKEILSPRDAGTADVQAFALPFAVLPAMARQAAVGKAPMLHIESDADQAALATRVYMIAMNPAAYEALPADLRALIDDAADAGTSIWFATHMQALDQAARDSLSNDTIRPMSLAEYERLRTAARAVQKAWLNEMKALGFDGQQLIDGARTLIKQHTR